MSKKEAAHRLRVLASVMNNDSEDPLVQSWADEIYHIAEKLDNDK